MADFSKQYYDSLGWDWWDFDYEDLFNDLQKEEYFPVICEGLGTLGVYRSESDQMLLAVQVSKEEFRFKTLEEVVESLKNNHW